MDVSTFWTDETILSNEARVVIYNYQDGSISFDKAVELLEDNGIDVETAMKILE